MWEGSTIRYRSYNYASGNYRRTRDTVLFAMKASLVFIVAVAAACYLGAGSVIALFMKNESIVAYGSRFLRGFCIGLPFLCADYLAVGVFQAVGMGKEALAFAVIRALFPKAGAQGEQGPGHGIIHNGGRRKFCVKPPLIFETKGTIIGYGNEITRSLLRGIKQGN